MQNKVLIGNRNQQRCREFAEQSVSTSTDMYKRRGQLDPRIIQHQIEIGKLGEVAAYAWLKANNLQASEPDFTIYEAKRKTFSPDMTLANVERVPIHVKSQDEESARRFGRSWTFQYGGGSSDKEVFCDAPVGFVIFTGVNGNEVTIYGAPTCMALHKHNLFAEPKLERLRGIKVVVYDRELQTLPEYEKWGLTSICLPLLPEVAPSQIEA